MSFDLSTLKTDKNLETEGVWVDYLGGSKLLIARNNNSKYRSFVSMKYKQNRMVIDRGGREGDVLAEKIQIEGLARHILLDWQGVEVEGKPQKYTHELGQKALSEFSDFKSDVETFSNDTTLYSAAAQAQDSEELKK